MTSISEELQGQAAQLYISEQDRYIQVSSSALDNDASFEDVAAVFFDYNQDGYKDLFVLSGGNQYPQGDKRYHPRLYLNDENKGFSKSQPKILSLLAGIGGALALIDYDNDGDEDLLIGNRVIPQKYPQATASFLLRNDGGSMTDVTSEVIPQLSDVGIVNDISVIDIDNDGDSDIAIAAEWEAPVILQNTDGEFKQLSGDFDALSGMYFSVTPADINGDGLMDLVYGNIGENFKLSPSQEEPLMVYAGDFDHNGSHDLVLTKTYKGVYVPVRGRECSSQQMPFILDKFETYDEFANSSLNEIYGDVELSNAYTRAITTTSSYALINNGAGSFAAEKLPVQAQMFPLLNAYTTDMNQDGKDDIIGIGSIYDMEVETPRLDAGTGLALISDGERLEVDHTGFYDIHVAGESKSMVAIQGPEGKNFLLIARNNGPLALIQL